MDIEPNGECVTLPNQLYVHLMLIFPGLININNMMLSVDATLEA